MGIGFSFTHARNNYVFCADFERTSLVHCVGCSFIEPLCTCINNFTMRRLRTQAFNSFIYSTSILLRRVRIKPQHSPIMFFAVYTLPWLISTTMKDKHAPMHSPAVSENTMMVPAMDASLPATALAPIIMHSDAT